MAVDRLRRLVEGQPIVFGGDRITSVDAALAAAFVDGDRLVVVHETGDLLHIPLAEHVLVGGAVGAAVDAFSALSACSDDQITAFFDVFASRLADDGSFAAVAAANADDVAKASAAGRSTTRLVLGDGMRADMIDGLRGWRDVPLRRDVSSHVVDHDGWSVEARRAPLGVVGFVFEGRPNVFADAAGVVRTGNTVVLRIGSDALGTARAITEHAVAPALAEVGLPPGTISLVASPARAAGWALFADPRLSLAVARGSGAAVAQLGAVARQTGTPVSLHGTGGAWLVAGEAADAARLRSAIVHSLDRKVCNTVNVIAVPRSRVELVGVVLDAVDAAAQRRSTAARVHVEASSCDHVPAERFTTTVTVTRADGDHDEPAASTLDIDALATEWEWEHSPEVSLVVVDDVAAAVSLCNRLSPRFVAALISDDQREQADFYAAVDAPFVGDGFTRWVDGQYALSTPELGLSNWQGGRLLARGAVLSGDSIHTVRYRATIADADLHR